MNYNYPGYSGGYKPTPPQYSQWAPPITPQLPQVRPVSSIEEVKACPIDFDGSVFYFSDVANKRIYTKQINIDGTASINLYELKPFTAVDHSADTFITRQEFEQAISQLKEMCKPREPEVSLPNAAQPSQKIEFQF